MKAWMSFSRSVAERKHGVSFHCYADDTKIYMPFQKNDKNALIPLLNCLMDVKIWMALHFLKFNDSKTEIILFGQTENLASVNVHLGPLAAHNKVAVKNLGVWFDRELKFDKQINNVVKSCFFNLTLLAKVKPFLKIDPKGSIYNENKRGSRMDP